MSTDTFPQVSTYRMRVWDGLQDGTKLGVSIGGTEYLIGEDQLKDLITDLTNGLNLLKSKDTKYSQRLLKALDWVEGQIEDYGKVSGLEEDPEEVLNLKTLLGIGQNELHRIVQNLSN